MEDKPNLFKRIFSSLWFLTNTLRKVIINLVFFTVLLIVILASSSDKDLIVVPEKTALVLNLRGDIVEQKRQASDTFYLITVNNQQYDCQGSLDGDIFYVNINGHRVRATFDENGLQTTLFLQNGAFKFNHVLPDCGDSSNADAHGGLTAPMNGTIVSVLINAGTEVVKDQPLIIMEAMKMEHTIKAPSDGIVKEVFFNSGDMVDGGCELLEFEAKAE